MAIFQNGDNAFFAHTRGKAVCFVVQEDERAVGRDIVAVDDTLNEDGFIRKSGGGIGVLGEHSRRQTDIESDLAAKMGGRAHFSIGGAGEKSFQHIAVYERGVIGENKLLRAETGYLRLDAVFIHVFRGEELHKEVSCGSDLGG